jgi:hypothetical protein
MFFEFNPARFREQLHITLQPLQLSLQASQSEADRSALRMIDVLMQHVDIMERADADSHQTETLPPLDVSAIAEHVFGLLDQLADIVAHRGLQKEMLQLQRLAVPVANWLHAHKGVINRLDLLVNALASFANELTDTSRLQELAEQVEKIVGMAADDIKQDLDNSDPRRPWRVLNLNWGIIATRSHNTLVMERTFNQLLKNIPLDVNNFFKEGMQQMAIVNYPQHVKDVMEKYYSQVPGVARRH